MAHVLVNKHAFYQLAVFQLSSLFSFDFNQFKIDVFAIEIGDRHNRTDCDFSELSVTLRDSAHKREKADSMQLPTQHSFKNTEACFRGTAGHTINLLYQVKRQRHFTFDIAISDLN